MSEGEKLASEEANRRTLAWIWRQLRDGFYGTLELSVRDGKVHRVERNESRLPRDLPEADDLTAGTRERKAT